MTRMLLLSSLILFTLPAAAGFHEGWRARVGEAGTVTQLAQLYLDLTVETAPTAASGLGLHGTKDKPPANDDRLPDRSAQALAAGYSSLAVLRERLAALDTASMPRADQIDHHILGKQVALDLLQLDELRGLQDPMGWVQTLGGAFTNLVLRDYAPLE